MAATKSYIKTSIPNSNGVIGFLNLGRDFFQSPNRSDPVSHSKDPSRKISDDLEEEFAETRD